MPTLVDEAPRHAASARARASGAGVSPGAVVLAAALPILFLHIEWQPAVSLPLGATFKLQDAAVLAALLAAFATGVREGLGALRAARAVWLALGLLLAWILLEIALPLTYPQAYAWKTHFDTYVEFVEYALLAPALPLLLRRRADWLLAAAALVAWSVAATATGLLQWGGLDVLGAWSQGRRQPSFVGTHDLAALSGMTLGLGLLALIWRVHGRERRLAWVSLVAGVLGFAVSGTSAGIVGLVPAVAIAAVVALRQGLLSRRAAAGAAAVTAVAVLGVLALRAGDFHQFFRFLGTESRPTAAQTAHVQTYSQRTLLAYVGLRIWERHPLVGAGWQASVEDSVVTRELPAAHRRFPHLAAQAYPAPGREYGVQLLYVQALSDLGVVGLLLLAATLLLPLWLGVRVALRAVRDTALGATTGVFFLVLAAGLFSAIGFTAGIPTWALLWLGIGTIAAAANAGRRGAAS